MKLRGTCLRMCAKGFWNAYMARVNWHVCEYLQTEQCTLQAAALLSQCSLFTNP